MSKAIMTHGIWKGSFKIEKEIEGGQWVNWWPGKSFKSNLDANMKITNVPDGCRIHAIIEIGDFHCTMEREK